MSQYLVIKKDGVTLGEWSSSTCMYQAFPGATYEEKVFNPAERFEIATLIIQSKIDEYKKSIIKYNKMLDGNLAYEERWDCLTSIEELEEEIEECKKAMHDVLFMQDCWGCDRYEENPPKWTWEIC